MATRYFSKNHLKGEKTTDEAPALASSPLEPLVYTAAQTCLLLGGISQVTLWRWVRRDLLRPIRTSRHLLFARKEIERFLAEQTEAR